MLSFLVYSIKRKVIPIPMGLGQPYSTSTNRRHGGRSTTLRNQQHENFVKKKNILPFLSGSGLTRMVGTTNIHLVRILDTCRTIEDC
jgi:hypothetical protein